jgi:AcrR family transcriptional regulator
MTDPRRSDSRRNREAILRAADLAFTGDPDVAPMHEIARRVGLGRSTIYRHFPDQGALAQAVAVEQIDVLRRALTEPDGIECPFRDVLRAVLSARWTRGPLLSVFRGMPTRDRRRHVDLVIEALTPAFEREQAAGRLRADFEPAHIEVLFAMVEAGARVVPEGRPGRAQGKLVVEWILDGLFTTGGG